MDYKIKSGIWIEANGSILLGEGRVSLLKAIDEEGSLSKAAKSLGLGVCGVDMLQSARGALILEVNSSPGLEGIEAATKKDIAKSIIRFIERNV